MMAFVRKCLTVALPLYSFILLSATPIPKAASQFTCTTNNGKTASCATFIFKCSDNCTCRCVAHPSNDDICICSCALPNPCDKGETTKTGVVKTTAVPGGDVTSDDMGSTNVLSTAALSTTITPRKADTNKLMTTIASPITNITTRNMNSTKVITTTAAAITKITSNNVDTTKEMTTIATDITSVMFPDRNVNSTKVIYVAEGTNLTEPTTRVTLTSVSHNDTNSSLVTTAGDGTTTSSMPRATDNNPQLVITGSVTAAVVAGVVIAIIVVVCLLRNRQKNWVNASSSYASSRNHRTQVSSSQNDSRVVVMSNEKDNYDHIEINVIHKNDIDGQYQPHEQASDTDSDYSLATGWDDYSLTDEVDPIYVNSNPNGLACGSNDALAGSINVNLSMNEDNDGYAKITKPRISAKPLTRIGFSNVIVAESKTGDDEAKQNDIYVRLNDGALHRGDSAYNTTYGENQYVTDNSAYDVLNGNAHKNKENTYNTTTDEEQNAIKNDTYNVLSTTSGKDTYDVINGGGYNRNTAHNAPASKGSNNGVQFDNEAYSHVTSDSDDPYYSTTSNL